MIVRASDDSRLGVVTACGNARLYLRKGLVHPQKYAALYAEIADLTKGYVTLRRGAESLTEAANAPPDDGPLTHTKPIFSLPQPPSTKP
jgi:hypothetical protein